MSEWVVDLRYYQLGKGSGYGYGSTVSARRGEEVSLDTEQGGTLLYLQHLLHGINHHGRIVRKKSGVHNQYALLTKMQLCGF